MGTSQIQARRGHHLQLLLLFTLIAMVGFGVPRLLWATHVGYSLIALLLTQVMVQPEDEPIWRQRLYRGLGLLSVGTMWIWLLTPLELIYSGVPLALSWSLLVGWSVIRLVKRFAVEPRVNEALLMGATAGYLHIGLTAGLVMSALETIQPGSFEPLAVQAAEEGSVLGGRPGLFRPQLFRLRLPHHRGFRRHQPDAAPGADGECGHQHHRTAVPGSGHGGTDRPLRQQP